MGLWANMGVAGAARKDIMGLATRSRLRLRGAGARRTRRGAAVWCVCPLWVWDLRPGVRPLGGVAYRYRLRRRTGRTLIIVRDADGCDRDACEVRPYEQ